MLRRIREFFSKYWGLVVALVVLVVTFVIDRLFLVTTAPVVIGMSPWLFWILYIALVLTAAASLATNAQQVNRARAKARMMDYVIA